MQNEDMSFDERGRLIKKVCRLFLKLKCRDHDRDISTPYQTYDNVSR